MKHQLPVMLVMLAMLEPVTLAMPVLEMPVLETVAAAVVMVVVTVAVVENEHPALQSSLRCKTTKRQFLPVCDQKC